MSRARVVDHIWGCCILAHLLIVANQGCSLGLISHLLIDVIGAFKIVLSPAFYEDAVMPLVRIPLSSNVFGLQA